MSSIYIDVRSDAMSAAAAATARRRKRGRREAEEDEEEEEKLSLKKFGYTNVAKLSVTERRRSLVAACQSVGDVTPVLQILQFVERVNRRHHPQAADIFDQDLAWLERNAAAIQEYIDG